LAAARRATSEIRPRARRQKRGKAFAALTRRPTLVRVGVALVVLFVGLGVFRYLQPRHARENQAGSETLRRRMTASAPADLGDVHKDSHAVASSSNARHDVEASTSVKAAVQRSTVAQRDPALDAWFISSYLRCWTPPPALPQSEKYAAQIRVVHNLDGSLSTAPQLVNPPSDPEWRAYADSAIRAAARCPLQVPARYLPHFDQWRKMTLHFSPDGAL
jgi:hypothetical protein